MSARSHPAQQTRLVPRDIAPFLEAGRWLVNDARYPETVVNGVPVVAAPAEIDITTADQFRIALLDAAGSRHPVVVVDMTGTRFCDSAALHALAAAHVRAQANGGELRLVIPADGTVPRVLAVTGIGRFIPCFAHLEEALANAADGTKPATGPTQTSHAAI